MNRRSFGLSLALAAMGVSSPAFARNFRSSCRGSLRADLPLRVPDEVAEPWGTIRGQFVFQAPGGKLPARVPVNVSRDRDHCLSKGPIFEEKWTVDPKTKGVRWVAVWIAPEKNGAADHDSNPRIHPTLRKIKETQVLFEVSCCKFEPHVGVLRIGQDLVVKNSAVVAHNAKIDGCAAPIQNNLLLPGLQVVVPARNWKPDYLPATIACNIHPWMRAFLFVLGHPYFASSNPDGTFEIKNVPAGKLRILMWHEETGWLHSREQGKKGFAGQAITVEGGETLDFGKLPVKPLE